MRGIQRLVALCGILRLTEVEVVSCHGRWTNNSDVCIDSFMLALEALWRLFCTVNLMLAIVARRLSAFQPIKWNLSRVQLKTSAFTKVNKLYKKGFWQLEASFPSRARDTAFQP